MMKKILVTIESLSDTYYAELGEKTPLESANKPNIDFFASIGSSGTIIPMGENFVPTTPETLFVFHGYNPSTQYPGMGVVDALGAGVEIDGTVFKIMLMALDGEGNAHPIEIGDEQAREMYKYLNRHVIINTSPVKMKVVHTKGCKGLLFLDGEQITNKVLTPDKGVSTTFNSNDTVIEQITPLFGKPFRVEPSKALERSEESRKTAVVLNEFAVKAKAMLSNHPLNKERLRKELPPANFILIQGPSSEKTFLESLDKKTGGKWCVISSDLSSKGVAALVHAKHFHASGDTVEERLGNAARLLKDNWEAFDSFHLHFSDLTGPSLKGDLLKKRELIEKLDKHFFYRLTDGFDLQKIVLCVAATSHVPCSQKIFEAGPLPFMVCGPKIQGDGTKSFCEKECAKGTYNRVEGSQLISLL